jgi:hypothetical protein
VLMVGVDSAAVEGELLAGRLGCPCCGVGLAPWGSARERELRSREGGRRFRPRRAICAGCGTTHVLLPDDSLARRRDGVVDIGDALVAKSAGCGHRAIAVMLGREPSTVRGWLRRFALVAVRVREHFTCWAVALDPMLGLIVPAGSVFADAVEAVGMAAAAVVRRLGPVPAWQFASAVTGGSLLSNTSCPWVSPA